MVNKTINDFVVAVKTKPLSSYTLDELQEALSICYILYNRFKKIEQRQPLSYVWNKMGAEYNRKLREVYPHVERIYPEIIALNIDL